jgi:N6-L-threonylcarbamoyladenine synthase
VVSAAKALALVWDVPFVAVNHLEAHLYASFLEQPDLEMPLVVLLVSGGHTMLVHMQGHGRYRLLGQTIDDARASSMAQYSTSATREARPSIALDGRRRGGDQLPAPMGAMA